MHDPEVWRRVAVPADFTFYKLHKVIQAAFGWKGHHLFTFREAGKKLDNPARLEISIPSEEDDRPVTDARRGKVKDVLTGRKEINYVYDFGDYWEHTIAVERSSRRNTSARPCWAAKADALPGTAAMRASGWCSQTPTTRNTRK